METVGSLAKKVMRSYPNKQAVIYGDKVITYKDLYERAMAMTCYLSELGLKKGDRFGILMSNRLEHVELDLVAAFGGFIKVPLNYRLHPNEHEYMIQDADMKVIIGEEELITPININVEALFTGDDYDQVINNNLGKEVYEEIQENDLFAIMYTSGTTGNPKGVMLSNRNIIAGALSLSQACEVNKHDVIGHVAPLTHGSNFLTHIAWFHGNTQIIYDKFSPEEFLDDIAKDQVTVIFLVPTMVNLMVQHPEFDPDKLKTVKSINMAGSAIAASKLQDALDQLGTVFVQTFGQVEAPMCITMMMRDELSGRLQSCGRPGPFVEMKIIDEQWNELPTREVGEIVCKGSLVMQGYWNNEKGTEETLVDGWLRTGDLGWVDELGYLHIVDRIKEVIISGGMNIYPREIEEVINKHRGVKEIAVIGIPNEKWGEAVIAYIVPNGVEEVKEEDVFALCENELARFKKPKEIFIIDELPKSSYGKILKRQLVEQHTKAVR